MRARRLVASVLALLLALPATIAVPALVFANVCPAGYVLVENQEPFLPPAGADFNHNGFQCQSFDGQLMLLSDDVPEDLDVDQCGEAFVPQPFDPNDQRMAAKDRNGDGVVCLRYLHISQADDLEMAVIRDN
jgi:hypothetical protein